MANDNQGSGTEIQGVSSSARQVDMLPEFGGLSGIADERKEHARDKTTLDKLLEISSRIIPEFAQKTPVTRTRLEFEIDYLLKDHYDELYNRLKDIELKEVSFTEDDLRWFILSNANSDNASMGIRASQWLGIFTGCLLQLLTERNDSEGKRTSFYINGNGNRFDYLFLGVRRIHDVFVENFSGNYICNYIASHGGEADLVCGRNLKGHHSLSTICRLEGVAKQVIGIRLEGDYAFTGCGSIRGNIHQLIGVEVKGNYYLSNAGGERGHITQLVGVDINGKSNIESVGSSERQDAKGKIDWAIFDNLQPDPFLRDVFANHLHYNFETPNSPLRKSYQQLLDNLIVEKVRTLVKTDYPQMVESLKELYGLKTMDDVLNAMYGKSKIISYPIDK